MSHDLMRCNNESRVKQIRTIRVHLMHVCESLDECARERLEQRGVSAAHDCHESHAELSHSNSH